MKTIFYCLYYWPLPPHCLCTGTGGHAGDAKIKDEAKNHSQVAMIAHNLTDVCGPRLTNSPGYNRADWVTDICKQWGLANAGREAWGEFGRAGAMSRNAGNENALLRKHHCISCAPVQEHQKSTTCELLMLDALILPALIKWGCHQRKDHRDKTRRSTAIPDAFKAYATRYGDSSLIISPINTWWKKEMEGFLPFIKRDYYTKLYLDEKGAVAWN